MYALIDNDTVTRTWRTIPARARRRLDTQEWVMNLELADTELREACGIYQIATPAAPVHDAVPILGLRPKAAAQRPPDAAGRPIHARHQQPCEGLTNVPCMFSTVGSGEPATSQRGKKTCLICTLDDLNLACLNNQRLSRLIHWLRQLPEPYRGQALQRLPADQLRQQHCGHPRPCRLPF